VSELRRLRQLEEENSRLKRLVVDLSRDKHMRPEALEKRLRPARCRELAQWLWDVIVTLIDATTEIYSAFFVEEEGTLSSFRGLREVIETKGLFSALYTERGSHYWLTEAGGGRVDKIRLTQVRRAVPYVGITLIPAYSPEARGRSERVFRTLQDRLPKELALAGITEMAAANWYLPEHFLP